jgi:hypothetical protein
MLLLAGVQELRGQLSGSNLMEYQLGNLPDTEPPFLSSHYDQLNLAYRHKGLTASIRYEHFFSQLEESSYYRISQFRARYRSGKLDIKVGNFNETLGNGLLMRGFEIPGSIFEEEAYRTRYGFYRDMLGFSASYLGNIWYFQAVRGKSLVNTLPPTQPPEERRIDLVEGMETGVQFLGQKAGLILMRNSNPVGDELFYSLLWEGMLGSILSYNLEYAHDLDSDRPVFAMDEASRYGLYASVGMFLGNFGLSLEYKNYHNMFIGSGISDPPTTVREQKYKVLNRSIHVPILDDESGFQLEAYYTFPGREHLVLNFTRAKNELFRQFLFHEIFAEFSFYPGQRNDLRVFADLASDEFKSEDLRMAGGLVWDYALVSTWSTQVHLEYQYIERTVVEVESMHNGVVILGFSQGPKFSLSAIWELSTDPFLTDIPSTFETERGIRHWPGMEASYRINPSNTLSLFAGKRRGGPACTSGICYEVLDFEGVEIRLKTNF